MYLGNLNSVLNSPKTLSCHRDSRARLSVSGESREDFPPHLVTMNDQEADVYLGAIFPDWAGAGFLTQEGNENDVPGVRGTSGLFTNGVAIYIDRSRHADSALNRRQEITCFEDDSTAR